MREYGWDRDGWPEIFEKVKAADILVLFSPTWLGEKSSASGQQDRLALYMTPFCPFCVMVPRVLNGLDAKVELRDISADPARTSGGPAGLLSARWL